MSDIAGLHHVTAVSSSARGNVDFFARTLGLRLVKKTVNFDDPGTYHLYFGDAVGTPGTVLTFFPWEGVPSGRPGTGEVSRTRFAIPAGALPFWERRLRAAGTTVETALAFGASELRARDPDGFALSFVEVPSDGRAGWRTGEIGPEAAVRGFAGVELTLADGAGVVDLLTGLFGYRIAAREGATTRLERTGADAGGLDVVERPDLPPARPGAGRVHHVAFRVPDRSAQARVRDALVSAGFAVTPPIDRSYFHAIYFRAPGGVLFEVATDEPGFLIDETEATLGTALKLPPQHERLRPVLETRLPALAV